MKKIYSASITPFTDHAEIDRESLERLIRFNLSHKMDGFFFFGTMGEWAVLSERMKHELLEAAVNAIGNQAEIIVGISSTGMNGIFDNMEKFSRYDCHSYVVQLPGGWAKPADPVAYLHRIADKSDKPVYLYYLPHVNGVKLSKSQFLDLFSHSNIKGVKNSSDSLKTRKELLILKEKADFTLFEGQEWVVDESLALGCDGALVGMAPLGVKIFKMIASAVDNGNLDEAGNLQKIVIEIFDGVYGTNLETVWIGQKYALKLLDIFTSFKTLVPSNENALQEEEKKRIEACIDKYKEYLV